MSNPFDAFDASNSSPPADWENQLAAAADAAKNGQSQFNYNGKWLNVADVTKYAKGTPAPDAVPSGNAFDQFDGAPTAPMSQGRAAGTAFSVGLDNAAAGLRALTPAPVRSAVDWLNEKLGGAPPPSIDPAVRATGNAALNPIREQYPITTALAEGAPSLAAKTPLGMAAMAALNYGTPQERATNAAGAYVGGKIGQYGGDLIGRALQPVRGAGNAAMDATKELFDKYGIMGLPSQIAGSRPMGWIESALANLPGGGRVRDVAGAQAGALNRATMSAMGASGDAVTPEAVEAAKGVLGSKFQSIPSGQTVNLDGTFWNRIGNVESDYMKNLSTDQRGVVKSYIDDLLNQGETMAGDAYQKARSRIAARASSTQDSELKNALTGIYKSLDDAFNRSATGDAAAQMATTRGQYRIAKTIAPTPTTGLTTVSGDVSPARLANSFKGFPGAGGDLGQLGARLKGLPSSGTAERAIYQSILTGGIGGGIGMATGDPTEAAKYAGYSLALPWLASQAITRAPFRNYLTSGILKVTPATEAALLRAGAGFGGLLGQGVAQ